MLTEADAERKGFEERERRRRHVRDDARIKARHDVIRRHNSMARPRGHDLRDYENRSIRNG